eukprot:1145413-Pelagomonas_calceolata.AAC.8
MASYSPWPKVYLCVCPDLFKHALDISGKTRPAGMLLQKQLSCSMPARAMDRIAGAAARAPPLSPYSRVWPMRAPMQQQQQQQQQQQLTGITLQGRQQQQLFNASKPPLPNRIATCASSSGAMPADGAMEPADSGSTFVQTRTLYKAVLAGLLSPLSARPQLSKALVECANKVAENRGQPGAVVGYEEIAEAAFGKFGKALISAIIYIELFGTCCVLFILEQAFPDQIINHQLPYRLRLRARLGRPVIKEA